MSDIQKLEAERRKKLFLVGGLVVIALAINTFIYLMLQKASNDTMQIVSPRIPQKVSDVDSREGARRDAEKRQEPPQHPKQLADENVSQFSAQDLTGSQKHELTEGAGVLYLTNGWPADWQPTTTYVVPNSINPPETELNLVLRPGEVIALKVESGWSLQPIGEPIYGLDCKCGDAWGSKDYSPYFGPKLPPFQHGLLQIRIKWNGNANVRYRYKLIRRPSR